MEGIDESSDKYAQEKIREIVQIVDEVNVKITESSDSKTRFIKSIVNDFLMPEVNKLTVYKESEQHRQKHLENVHKKLYRINSVESESFYPTSSEADIIASDIINGVIDNVISQIAPQSSIDTTEDVGLEEAKRAIDLIFQQPTNLDSMDSIEKIDETEMENSSETDSLLREIIKDINERLLTLAFEEIENQERNARQEKNEIEFEDQEDTTNLREHHHDENDKI